MLVDIADTQWHLWVEAELRQLDPADRSACERRIARAERALDLVQQSHHRSVRAERMHMAILERLRALCPAVANA